MTHEKSTAPSNINKTTEKCAIDKISSYTFNSISFIMKSKEKHRGRHIFSSSINKWTSKQFNINKDTCVSIIF